MENIKPEQPPSLADVNPLEEERLKHLVALSRYSLEPLSENVFFNKVLEILVAVTGSQAVVVWKTNSNRAVQLADYPPGIGSIEFDRMVSNVVSSDLISKVHSRGEAHYVTENINSGIQGQLQHGDRSHAISAGFHRAGQDREASLVVGLIYNGRGQILEPQKVEFAVLSISEWVDNYYRNVASRELRGELAFAQSLLRFSEKLSGFSEPIELLYETVNELTNLTNVDRVTAFQRKADRLEIAAISGVSTFSKSSEISNLLSAAVNEMNAIGLPTEVTRSSGSTPSVKSYFTKSNCLKMIAAPISSSLLPTQEAFEGVLLLEVFSESQEVNLDEKFLNIINQIDLALTNAIELRSKVNSRRISSKFDLSNRNHSARKHHKRIAGVALIVAFVGLFFVKTDFYMKAEGQVLPSNQRRIFSPVDGEIAKVFDARDDVFKKGDPLITVRSLGLEMQISKIKGEQLATQEKLFAIESRRITGGGRADDELDNANSTLSASAEELRILLESQSTQLEILNRQFESLDIESPLDGQIVTWQFRKLLDSRPVQRGQVLMTIADVNGDWIGELEVSDYRAGYVMEALRETGELPVSLVLVSSPERTHRGRLTKASFSTDEDQLGRPIMRATVAVNWTSEVKPRSGAKIIAKIKCGKKSLIYQWFHEPIANLRSALF